MMRRESYEQLMRLVLEACSTGHIADFERALEAERTCTVMAVGKNRLVKPCEIPSTLPEGSIVEVRVKGVLYPWVTEYLTDVVEACRLNESVSGVMFTMNSPGGMTNEIDTLSTLIRNLGKPTVCLVTGMMCSAACWIGTACDKVFLCSPTSEAGSIGVMGTYCNDRKMLEKDGIDYRVIYPDTSDLKNRPTRDIEERDDETLYKNSLQQLHLYFCHRVAEYRGLKYDEKRPLFRGETFTGDKAIAEGLADGYADRRLALNWIEAQPLVRESSAE